MLQHNSHIIFSSLIKEFFQRYKTNNNEFSFIIRKHLFPLIGDIKISNINYSTLRFCYVDLLETSTINTSTIEQIHKVIYDTFNYAVTMEYIISNPIPKKFDKIIINTFDLSSLTSNDVNKIINSAPSIVFKIAFLLGFKMGLTNKEILNIKWSDVDFKSRNLSIGLNTTNNRNSSFHRSTKFRVNSIPNSIFTLLIELKNFQACFRFCSEYKNSDFIICTDNGTPISSLTLSKVFMTSCRKHNIYDMRFFQTRQYYAYSLWKQGIDEDTATKILGSIPFPPNKNPYYN